MRNPSEQRILALDLAGRTGVAYGSLDRLPRMLSWQLADEMTSIPDREWRLFKHLMDFVKVERPTLIAVEAALTPAHAQGQTNISAIRLAIGLITVAQLVARLERIPIREEKVQDVRGVFIAGRQFLYRGKDVTGSRGMKGEIAKHCVMLRCREMGMPVLNKDESDAAALWFYTATRLIPSLAWDQSPLGEAQSRQGE